MNRLLIYVLSVLIIFIISGTTSTKEPQTTNLESHWDTIRPLANPDKGWYHHMLDNGVHKYLIQDEEELHNFPGMDHLYLRLCWAFLEPEEGKFDWSHIDNIVDKYVPMGYGISFRISCKETGGVPGSVPQEIDGVRYATPYWVKQAGAKGVDCPEFGSCSWTPFWDDPIFLEKLDNFHKAFAEKYDGKPWVRYVDIGSIGDWGEGHTSSSTNIPPAKEEIIKHIDLYKKHYKRSQLVATDDLIFFKKPDSVLNEILKHALQDDITFRDDSPFNRYWLTSHPETWSVNRPEFFEAAYKIMPTILETAHYTKIKEWGFWKEKNGTAVIPEIGHTGAEVFRNVIETLHATYIGFHGYIGDWYNDNPKLATEMLNLCGYWYFPKTITITDYENGKLSLEIDWLNKGVAPAYNTYSLKGKLIPVNKEENTIEFEIRDSGNKNWMPGEITKEAYQIELLQKPGGKYIFAVQLFDKKSGKPVEIGLSKELKENEFFTIAQVTL